ncbi:telomeric repeat binding factor a [Cynoglossus semilaevis]|uniref:telomeric repeat binding factor a n=1 Tax=Cynoglossus semilaevis TaxID=244447 RepID=UPI0007DCACE5|nr:uncharacterized protein LOC103398559 [Cynoglossus semilaevis]
MAAKKTSLHSTECRQNAMKTIINRWIVDHYASLALESLTEEQYEEFCSIKHVLDCIQDRFVLACQTMLKIQVVEFLYCIFEGAKFDLSLVPNQSTAHLKKALMLLESICQEYSVPQQDFDKACMSIYEMIVVIFIKNCWFEKAKQILTKHFPGPNVGKKAILLDIISQKCKTHDIFEQIKFNQFRQEMLAFCQRLCPFGVPFMHMAARKLIDESFKRQDDNAVGPEELEEPGLSSSLQSDTAVIYQCKHKIITKTSLEAAFNVLHRRSDKITCSILEEEWESEEQTHGDLLLCLSAEQLPQMDTEPQAQGRLCSQPAVVQGKKWHNTVAQLVVEPDSNTSSQSTTILQDLETQVTQEPPQSPPSSTDVSQSPLTDIKVSVPSRKFRRKTKNCSSRTSTGFIEMSTDSEVDFSGSHIKKKAGVKKLHIPEDDSITSNSNKSDDGGPASNGEGDQESFSSVTSPAKAQDRNCHHRSSPEDIFDTEALSDSSPNHCVPQKSSTPQKLDFSSNLKWKVLMKTAKESKERWSDDESVSCKSGPRPNDSITKGHRKRKWSDSETKMLEEGVKMFGEGNWNKIREYYDFNGRTNVNLKDRWRTMKKLYMV